MPWTNLFPKNLDELYGILNKLADTQAYVFRGHASATWPHLEPSLHRVLADKAKFDDNVMTETTAIAAFRRHARSLLQAAELTYFDGILDSVTLMQHYGAPTRLLDWTLSPWVACYFATDGSDDDDAVIWTFNQQELVKKNQRPEGSREFDRFRDLITVKKIEEWFEAASEAGQFVDSFRYMYANPQMSAQQSLFTIAGRLGDNHDEVLAKTLDEPWHTLRIRIPQACKKVLRQRLFLMNVSALALFPTINGVGRNIRESILAGYALSDEALLRALEEKARGLGDGDTDGASTTPRRRATGRRRRSS
jgi:hypothetical protein